MDRRFGADGGVGRRTIASLRLTTPIDLTRNYCSNHTRDSCLLFIYRLRCIFDAARPNNRQANIRYNGRPNISPGNVVYRAKFPPSFPLPGQNFFLSFLSTRRLFSSVVIARMFYTKAGEKTFSLLRAFLQIRENFSIRRNGE